MRSVLFVCKSSLRNESACLNHSSRGRGIQPSLSSELTNPFWHRAGSSNTSPPAGLWAPQTYSLAITTSKWWHRKCAARPPLSAESSPVSTQTGRDCLTLTVGCWQRSTRNQLTLMVQCRLGRSLILISLQRCKARVGVTKIWIEALIRNLVALLLETQELPSSKLFKCVPKP